MSEPTPNHAWFKLTIVAITVGLCLCVHYYFFQKRIKEFDGYKLYSTKQVEFEAPFSSYEQMLNLGWAHRKKPGLTATSYLNYDTLKPQGTFRIGVFGCSFTEGFDCDSTYDFPTLLQHKYEKEGYKNVQVINFGTGGYGVGQMLMLYNYIGKKYNLDLVVLNLYFFYHFPRDLSFRLYNNYGPIHARYILDENKLKLIEPGEPSLPKSYSDYYSLSPKSIYRNYDYKANGFLIPLKLKYNPFYYRKVKAIPDMMNEAYQLYDLMLKEFAGSAKKLLVISNDEHIYSLSKNFAVDSSIAFYKSNYYNILDKSVSLYTTPSWHNSPLGNQFYADELFNEITGKKEALAFLKPEFLKTDSIKPISAFDSIAFKFGDSYIHNLYEPSADEISAEDWNREPDYATKISMDAKHVQRLLLLSKSLSDLCFVNLPNEVKDLDTVRIQFVLNNTNYSIPIALIAQINPLIYKIDLLDSLIPNKNFTLSLKANFDNLFSDFRILFLSQAKIENVTFEVGKNHIQVPVKTQKARLSKSDDVYNFDYNHLKYVLSEDFADETLLSATEIRPIRNTDVYHCRTAGSEYTNPDSIGEEGQPLNLVIYLQGKEVTCPFLLLRKHMLTSNE
jgi:hypothetical protein